MENKIVTVVGGTGFVGRQMVKHLARAGYMVNVVSRTPEQAHDLKVLGPVGKVVLSRGNIRDIDSIRPYLQNNYAVIDLVGIMHESGKQKFSTLHVKAAGELAKAASAAGARKFIYMSALGVDKAEAKYAKSKFQGEQAVAQNFPEAIILRPSLIFGKGDGFFSKFAPLARISPFLPLIGGGETLFQPISVDDVGEAAVKILDMPAGREKIFEIAGPQIYSLKTLLELMLAEMRIKRMFIVIPSFIAGFKAFFLQLLPCPLLTVDQVRMLKYNSILSQENGLAELGIKPSHLETALPDILLKYRKNK